MDVNDRIKQQIENNPVLLYMKGTPDFPQCGFSGQTVAALKSIGKPVVRGEPLARVHAASEEAWQTAAAALRRAFEITDGTPATNPVVHSIVEGASER